MTELAGLELRNVTLSLPDSFWVALFISVFSIFPASYFSKTGVFSPHKGLEPLSVGSKVERSTKLHIWTRWKLCPFSCCHFERSAKFFAVFCFYLTAHRDSFWILLVNSEFLCYLAFNSVKRGFLATHKRLEPLKYGLKDQRSIDWGSGTRIAACHIVSCF